MLQGIRFSPPPCHLDADTRWVLARAFGAAGQELPDSCPGDGASAFATARKLGIAARVGARTPLATLAAEAGEEAAQQFLGAVRTTAAGMVVLEQLCELLADLAEPLGLPLVFLKGAAMHLSGVVEIGLRPSGDVDVLVPATEAGQLYRAVAAAGFAELDHPAAGHHLPPLICRQRGAVEVHRVLWGVRLSPGGGFAEAGQILTAGLARRLPDLAGSCHVPCRELLLAHLLVHAVVQHTAGFSYPLARLIGDIQDLDLAREEWHTFCDGPYRWVGEALSREEVTAVADLARLLAAGEDPAAILADNGGASLLLRQLVLGTLNHEYRQSQRLRRLSNVVLTERRAATLLRLLVQTVWLTRGQVDAIYGKQATGWGYLGRRLWRPADLVVRACRFAWAWLKQRRCRPPR